MRRMISAIGESFHVSDKTKKKAKIVYSMSKYGFCKTKESKAAEKVF